MFNNLLLNSIQISKKKCIFSIFIAFIATSGLLLGLDPASQKDITRLFGNSFVSNLIGGIVLSFPDKNAFLSALMIFVLLLYLILFALSNDRSQIKYPWFVLPAILFSLSMVGGYSLATFQDLSPLLESPSQLVKTVWAFFGYFVLASTLFFLLNTVLDQDKTRQDKTRQNKLYKLFSNHAFSISAGFLALAWLPQLIGCYPGLIMGDTGAQILQWFNLPNWTSTYLNLINPEVLLNAHHPVLHTMIIGSFVALGNFCFGSYNIGLFCYTLFQYIITVLTISYAISSIKKIGVSTTVCLAILAFCCLFPFFGQYVVLATKDTLFSCSTLIVFLFFYRIVQYPVSLTKKDWIISIFGFIGFAFLRNGTMVLLFIVFILLCIFFKHSRRKALSIFIPLTVFFILINYVLFPFLQITPGSTRESLSIPIQQISRCVVEHESEIPNNVKNDIDAVISYDDITTLYNPVKSDPVKATWKENSDRKDLINFFNAWLYCFSHYPTTCLEATALNYYGLFYPANNRTILYNLDWSERQLEKESIQCFNFHHLDNPLITRLHHFNNTYMEIWQRIPLLSIFTSCSLYFWIILFCMLWAIRNKRPDWIACVFLFVVLLIALIAPINASYYTRYVIPIVFSAPFCVALLYFAFNNKTSIGAN